MNINTARKYFGTTGKLVTNDIGCDSPGIINTTRWASEYLEIETRHHQQYHKWASQQDSDLETWQMIDKYMEEHKMICTGRIGNTMENENDFDTQFEWAIYEPEEEQNGDWVYARKGVIVIYTWEVLICRSCLSWEYSGSPHDVEYIIPLTWQCNYHLLDTSLEYDHNRYMETYERMNLERLSSGYSNYPYGQFEEIGLKWVNTDKDHYIFRDKDGFTHRFVADYMP